jgi:antitoxin (DNA-binding transcriptional repressor) of toxin-antitoxin stability system
MATTVNMGDAKSSLSKLAARPAAGEDILIARAGKPVAMLTCLPRKGRKRLLGLYTGKIRISKGFDAPLPSFRAYT